MQIKATDKTGQVHNGKNIKHILACADDGVPIAVIKETIINEMTNYKVLTPNDKEFLTLLQALKLDVPVHVI